MTDRKDLEKESKRTFGSLTDRGLMTTVPKPNIVRIELLDGNARARYLGLLQNVGDSIVKKRYYDSLALVSNRTFYGFLKKGHQQAISITNDWNTKGGTGPFLNDMEDVSTGTLVDRKPMGFRDPDGTINWTKAAKGILNAGLTIARGAKIAKDTLAGTNSTFTGSSSVRRYGGVRISGFSVKCEWYLPEQYRLCAKSLQVLMKMSYPLQIQQSDIKYSNELLFNSVKKSYKDTFNNQTHEVLEKFDKIKSLNDPNGKDVTRVSAMFELGRRLVGRNLTFNPLPVRVSVGQRADVEPLVIDSVNLKFSKETFISEEKGLKNSIGEAITGRHLPITCEADIAFSFWLAPPPKLEFLSLLGQEFFGQDQPTFKGKPSSENSSENSSEK